MLLTIPFFASTMACISGSLADDLDKEPSVSVEVIEIPPEGDNQVVLSPDQMFEAAQAREGNDVHRNANLFGTSGIDAFGSTLEEMKMVYGEPSELKTTVHEGTHGGTSRFVTAKFKDHSAIFYLEGTKTILWTVTIIGDNVTLVKDIKLGVSAETIVETFGEPNIQDANKSSYLYYDEDDLSCYGAFHFTLENERVIEIQIDEIMC